MRKGSREAVEVADEDDWDTREITLGAALADDYLGGLVDC